MLARQTDAGYLGSVMALREADLTEIAKRIGVPAVVVVGEHDLATTPATCAEFARMIPAGKFELVKDAGHLTPVEQPAVLSEIIRAFTALAPPPTAATRH